MVRVEICRVDRDFGRERASHKHVVGRPGWVVAVEGRPIKSVEGFSFGTCKIGVEQKRSLALTTVDVVEALESALLPRAIERHFVRSRSSSSSGTGTGTGSVMEVGHPVFEDAGGGGPVARGRVEVEAGPGLDGRLTIGQAVLFADACARPGENAELGQ